MLTRRSLLIAGSISLALVPALCLRADVTADARKAIEANYAKIDAAWHANDLVTVYSFVMAGGKIIHETGQVAKIPSDAEKNKVLSKMSAAMQKSHAIIVWKTVIRTFTLKGYEATVKVTKHSKQSFPSPDHKLHTLVQDGISEEVWTKKGSLWLITRSRDIALKVTKDGMPAHD